MPRIVPYPDVLRTLESQQPPMRCVYHNSGAFTFAYVDPSMVTLGWIGPEDHTIRDDLRAMTMHVSAPFDKTLATLGRRAWTETMAAHAPTCWLMPKSHWAFELSDGSRDWLPATLTELGIAPAELAGRADASALAFDLHEAALLEAVMGRLLRKLQMSDFALAFPGVPAICTLHHHTQLWWQTTDENLGKSLRALPGAPASQAAS